jgi:outer membrane lipoprotein-sorting protein
MIPKENAAVVWGKVITWISKENFNQLKAEYYDEDGELVRTELLSEVKNVDNRMIPTHIEVIPEDEEGKKTVLELNEARFNRNITDGFFSQQNMKRVRP